MEKQKNTQIIVIAVLAVAILVMSVGFAIFTQNLTLNGTTTVASASWGLEFVPASYTETAGSVEVTPANRTIAGTSMTYNVSLEKPGDFYEFTVNVENKGTFDTNLTDITMSTLTAAQQKYLTYSIVYGGQTYTASATGLTHSLTAGNTAPVKVRVEYILPESSTDLPATEVTVNLTASLTYKQVGA